MGGNDIMGSELIFSDTVHQFLQVLTLSLKVVSRVFQKYFNESLFLCSFMAVVAASGGEGGIVCQCNV